MAIVFTGSAGTGPVTMKNGQIALSIECSLRSKCRVSITRIIAMIDTVAAVASANGIAPLFRLRKVVGTTAGGIIISARGQWDTAQTPDTGVIIRQGLGYTDQSDALAISVTGTPASLSESFSSRAASIFGQQLFGDISIFKKDDATLYLNPGESLLVYWVDAANPVGGSTVLNILWEEDSLGTEYTLSGDVSLGGSPVSGAKVVLVTDTDRDMPNPQVEVITTGAPGTWSKTLAAGVKADAFVQYRNGETLYTAEGKPYL